MFGWVLDTVSWFQAAALVVAIAAVGLVVLVSLAVLLIPFGDKLPVIGAYAKAAPFVSFIAFGLFCALLTLQLAGDRCDAQRAADREAAEAARVDRDDGIAQTLNRKYAPEIVRLSKLNSDLQGKVAHYAKQKQRAAADSRCRLGDAARRLPGT